MKEEKEMKEYFEHQKAEKIEEVKTVLNIAIERYEKRPNDIRKEKVETYKKVLAKLESLKFSDITITGKIELVAHQNIIDQIAEVATYIAFNQKQYI